MDGELRVEISGYRITVSKAPSPALASPAERLPAVDSCSSFELVDFASEPGVYSSAASPGSPSPKAAPPQRVSGQVPCVFAFPSLTFRCARVPIAGPLVLSVCSACSPVRATAFDSRRAFGDWSFKSCAPALTFACARVPLAGPLAAAGRDLC